MAISRMQEPRQMYGLGSLVRKATRAVKKVVKSPIGKAALLGAATFGVPGTSFSGLLGKGSLGSFFGKGSFNPLVAMAERGPGFIKGPSGLAKLLGKFGLAEGTSLTGLGKIAGIGGLSGLAGLLAAQEAEGEDEINIEDIARGEGLDISDIIRRARLQDPEFRFLPGAEFTQTYSDGGEVDLMGNPAVVGPKMEGQEMREFMIMNPDVEDVADYLGYYKKLKKEEDSKKAKKRDKAKTRTKKAEGGIMDLGGFEMDLRGGGFVPLGAAEKADDVPARLSKNEFVFTADAVRAAGGGSVDKGADKMYKTMKQLESMT
jgi:hypothetical protein